MAEFRSTIIQRIEIDAGHRLMNHEGKCRNYHGHRYAFEVEIAGALDEIGRVIDFGEVKTRLGAWLNEEWDHGMVLQIGDPLIPALLVAGTKVCAIACSPTAENMAAIVFSKAVTLFPDLRVVSVTCRETPNCSATFRGA